jgi:hypothetical protein
MAPTGSRVHRRGTRTGQRQERIGSRIGLVAIRLMDLARESGGVIHAGAGALRASELARVLR